MKRLKFNSKKIKVSEYSGNQHSREELERNNKYGLWSPENDLMTYSSGMPKTVAEFSRELKELHPNLYVVYNKNPSPPDAAYGHAIRIRNTNLDEKFDIVAAVGKSGDKLIPANSQKQHFYDEDAKEYRSRMVSIGWSEALNQVIGYLISHGLAKKG